MIRRSRKSYQLRRWIPVEWRGACLLGLVLLSQLTLAACGNNTQIPMLPTTYTNPTPATPDWIGQLTNYQHKGASL